MLFWSTPSVVEFSFRAAADALTATAAAGLTAAAGTATAAALAAAAAPGSKTPWP